MTEPKERSAFLPVMLLVLSLLALFILGSLLLPILECNQCAGLGEVLASEIAAVTMAPQLGNESPPHEPRIVLQCSRCDTGGRLTLAEEIFPRRPPPYYVVITDLLSGNQILKIKKMREEE